LTELCGLNEKSSVFVPSGGMKWEEGGRKGKLWLVTEKLVYPRTEIHMLLN